MNKIPKIIAFNLSTLSTLMLCIGVQAWGSDIQIYQKPKASDGKATVMLVLDNASIMHQGTASAGGGKPMDYDFGSICQASKSTELSETFSFNGKNYPYKSYYCDASLSDLTKNGVNASAIKSFCDPLKNSSGTITGYRCYDRFSMLKKSLFTAISSLSDNISIGLNFSPAFDAAGNALLPISPQPLTDTFKDTLLNRVAAVVPGLTNTGGKVEPIAQGYGAGTKALIAPVVGSVDQCTGYGVYQLTGGTPFQDVLTDARNDVQSILTKPSLLTITDCPDGGSGGSSAKGESWACVAAAANLLVNDKSKIAVPVKTAVVGFGAEFSFAGYPTYSSSLTPDVINTTAKALDKNANDPLIQNERYAAIAGVNGQGGYYAAAGGSEVIDSINSFIQLVAKVIIPPMTTGTVTIPQDPLNTVVVRDQAYYPQFKPTPDQNYQLWAGNLKKYKVTTQGQLVDKNGKFVFDKAGLLVDNYDFWSPAIDPTLPVDAPESTPGSTLFALMGGAKSQLALRTAANSTTVANRNLLTNRVVSGTGTGLTISEGIALRRIDPTYLTTASYQEDPARGYLMALLGYDINATTAASPSSITLANLQTTPELRQIGAVMHSSPLLFTNKGKIDYSSGTLSATNREDYVLFGTTQGLLHVVKAGESDTDTDGGKEVFAFVPNEMVNNQKQAFLKYNSTNGGTDRLFYGVDAPWTAYSQYVVDANGNLTVGAGKNSDAGKQLLYGGLRMGGRSYYSLNLQDVNSPKVNFHIDPASQKVYAKDSSGNSKSTTFTELQYMGQSWSKPKVAWVKWKGQRKLVMFVGGGYDAGGVDGDAHDSSGARIDYAGYEGDSYNQSNGKGAGVYMFDALNGDLLWWASNNASATSAPDANSGVMALKDPNLQYSVVNEIKTIDRDNDGLVDHLYFGDLAGQVFRIDLDNTAVKSGAFAKRSVRLMNLHATGGTSPRFYDAPAFSIYKNTSGILYAVISIGSGNRSLPLQTYATGTTGRDYDAIYNIYDKDVASRTLYSATTMTTQDVGVSGSTNVLIQLTDADRFSITTIKAPYTTAGWYYKFTAGSLLQSEKVMDTPIVINNDMYVSTYDQSKNGLTGTCGGGVKGESMLTAFCMPYGQCASGTITDNQLNLGVGIVGAAIGAGSNDGLTRLLVPNIDTSALTGANQNKILTSRYSTSIRLTPLRWYER